MKTIYRKEIIRKGYWLEWGLDCCYVQSSVGTFYSKYKNKNFSVKVEMLELSDIEKFKIFEKEILSSSLYVDKNARSVIKKAIDELRKLRIDIEILEETQSVDTNIKIIPLEEIDKEVEEWK